MLPAVSAVPEKMGVLSMRLFLHKVELEGSGCLPKDFLSNLPRGVWQKVDMCAGERPNLQDSLMRDPGRPVKQKEYTAYYLKCLAHILDLIGDTGIDEGKLDAFIDSMPVGADLISQWKANADRCRQRMDPWFYHDEKIIYMLSCLRSRLVIGCTKGDRQLCANVNHFLHLNFSRDSSALDSDTTWRRCSLKATKAGLTGTDHESADPDACPELRDRAVAIGGCVLRETGHASGDVLNMTAIRETITPPGEPSNSVNSLRIDALKRCQGASVDAFVRCWITESSEISIGKTAYELATASAYMYRRPSTY